MNEREAFEEYWNSLVTPTGASEELLHSCEFAAWYAWQARTALSQPAVPAPTTQVPVAWHKMARVWIGGDVFEDRWVACSEDSAGAEPLYAQSTQSAKEKHHEQDR